MTRRVRVALKVAVWAVCLYPVALLLYQFQADNLGANPIEHVTRTRMYVTDISRWEEAAAVHGEVFGDIRPATTMVEVARLIDTAALIEIEADATLPAGA